MASKFGVIVVTAGVAGLAGGGAFVRIDGREALLKSVELFLNRDNVCQIIAAFSPEMIEEAKSRHGAHFSFAGVRLASGGPGWIEQLAAAAEKLADEATHVIVHDGARPAVPYTDLENLMEAAETHSAVALYAPSRSGVVELDEGGNPLAVHMADRFAQLLMPQVFEKSVFMEMVKTKHEVHASRLHLVKGSPLNVRVGGPGDAAWVKAMLALMPKPKMKAGNPFEEAQW